MFGSGPSQPHTKVEVTPVTVFVGPNNSGKSKILRELEQMCVDGTRDQDMKIVESVTFIPVAETDVDAEIEALTAPSMEQERVQEGFIVVQSRRNRMILNKASMRQYMLRPSLSSGGYSSHYLSNLTERLDGPTRFSLVDDQQAGDLQSPGKQLLSILFTDDAKRAEVRRIGLKAFGTYFVIDPTKLGTLRIRLSSRAPKNDLEERNVHAEGVAFHGQATLISRASDGVKAFIGILVALIAGNPRVLLIDEPEAFLHPPLASQLGYELSRAAKAANKKIFASTHSPQFVMGCVQSGVPTNIVRLTYRDGVATARQLPSKEITDLMRNPLLRSTGVLNGLFYEFVVVTEGDSDRAFYQEINERLLRLKPEWGIPNCLFINAQNKHTLHTIVRPLRKLGIPTAAITDIDVFKEGGTNFSNLLSAGGVPGVLLTSLATARTYLKSAWEATQKDMKRAGGVDLLSPSDKASAEHMISDLAQYGIFVVPRGEVEVWLKHLSVTSHGSEWLVKMFEQMGEDPDAADYAKPSSNDVWAFISLVRAWLTDPNRKGIPA